MKPQHIAEVGAYMQLERRFYEQRGSGLGLMIAKRLTQIHGGSVGIRCQVGAGTELVASLPSLAKL
jgi:signal transduction histidine kinase